ncbi:hypothetical protein J5X84_24050 [Streptosporangiaceae bacterium NEAU-GS5]|nr:hypothetical protein [Streptosporangiaceae bacterium NEAU-GS5]
MAPLPGMARVGPSKLNAGGRAELLAIYGGLGSGRILLMGGPGAGKSSAAIMLLLDALNHRKNVADPARRARVPVPVLLTLSGWNPLDLTVTAWAALVTGYAAAGLDQAAAEALIEAGRTALLLDGLDDLHEDLRPVALRALREQAAGRLVLISRSQELADAVAEGHLPGAAPLELRPLTPAQAADCLARARLRPDAPWRPRWACRPGSPPARGPGWCSRWQAGPEPGRRCCGEPGGSRSRSIRAASAGPRSPHSSRSRSASRSGSRPGSPPDSRPGPRPGCAAAWRPHSQRGCWPGSPTRWRRSATPPLRARPSIRSLCRARSPAAASTSGSASRRGSAPGS